MSDATMMYLLLGLVLVFGVIMLYSFGFGLREVEREKKSPAEAQPSRTDSPNLVIRKGNLEEENQEELEKEIRSLTSTLMKKAADIATRQVLKGRGI